MIQLSSLSFTPAGTTVLDHLDLTVREGEIITLLGPSGSGKTTLLRMVAGLEVPDAGQVQLDETVLTDGAHLNVAASKRPFAYLFQDFTLFPHLTVRQNIGLGIRHLPTAEKKERVDAMAELLGITPLLKRRIHRLSGGEQQRVALARTLVMRPRLLMLDEPFSNLDPMTQQRLSRDVKRIAKDLGIAVLLASHNREEAFFFSDRLVVLSGGQKVAEGPSADLYRDPKTVWLATFTGETVLNSAEQLKQRFGHHLSEESESYLVRPEDIEILDVLGAKEDAGRMPAVPGKTDAGEAGTAPVPGAEATGRMPAVPGDWCSCEISGVEFYGTTSKAYVKDASGDSFHAAVLGPTSLRAGDRVKLRLVRDPVPLTV